MNPESENSEGTEESGMIMSTLLEQDPSFAEEVLLFIDDLKQRIGVIEAAFEKQDWNAIEFEVHKLSSAATFGYQSFTDVMQTLTGACRQESVSDITSALSEAQDQARRILLSRDHVESLLN